MFLPDEEALQPVEETHIRFPFVSARAVEREASIGQIAMCFSPEMVHPTAPLCSGLGKVTSGVMRVGGRLYEPWWHGPTLRQRAVDEGEDTVAPFRRVFLPESTPRALATAAVTWASRWCGPGWAAKRRRNLLNALVPDSLVCRAGSISIRGVPAVPVVALGATWALLR